MTPSAVSNDSSAPTIRSLRALWSALVEPHPRMSAAEDRHGARLFAILMMVQMSLVGILYLLIWGVTWHYLRHDIRGDGDTPVIMGGTALLLLPFLLLRTGRYHPAIALYIAITSAVPLVSPFLPGPNIEIGFLAMLILPPLLAAFVYPARWVIAILVTVIGTAAIRLATAGLPASTTGTGFAILMVIAVAGAMLLVFRSRSTVVERMRLQRLHDNEMTLRRTSERLRFLLANSQDILLGVDRDGTIRFLGGSVETILGWSVPDLLGLSILDLVHPDDSARIHTLFAGIDAVAGQTVRDEWRQKRSDGRLRWMEVLIANQLQNPDVATILINMRDVTERRLSEEDRGRITSRMQELARVELAGRLAGGVAHDFNNLLTVILGYLELADPVSDPPEVLRKRLDAIRDAAEKSAALARKLLVYSGRDIIHPTVIRVDDLLRTQQVALTTMFGPEVAVVLDLKAAGGSIRCDADSLERAVMNLALNAHDAMPVGGRFSIITERVTTPPVGPDGPVLSPASWIRMTATDTGSGMTDEVRLHLFEPFFTTKSRGIGTGLGLATLKGSVEQAGGLVSVESAPGRGTTVTMHFPLAEESPPAPEATGTPPAAHACTETILYAEDNENIRDIMTDVLARLGYRVLPAPDGAKALEIARRLPAPLHGLVTDMIMPGLNGRELAEALKEFHPETRVLYTSGYTEDILSDDERTTGSLRFLAKPHTGKELASAVRAMLDSPPVL